MKLYRFVLIVMFCAIQSVHAGSGYMIDLNPITLDTFFGKEIKEGPLRAALGTVLNLRISIPENYTFAKPDKAPHDYVYWMTPSDLQTANRTGDLPAKNGYFYGYVSANVGYDKQRNLFIGAEDEAAMKQAKAQFQDISYTRYETDGHPVLLIKGSDAKSGKYFFAAYIATNLDTNVLFIAFRPPEKLHGLGTIVWDSLAARMKANSKHSKPWSARIVDFGIYEVQKGPKESDSNVAGGLVVTYGKKLIQETDQIPAKKGLNFGFRYELLDGPERDAEVVIKIKHPSPLEDPETKKKFSTSKWGQRVPVGGINWNTGWVFEHDWEIVPGEWLIELYIGEVKLAEKKFFVNVAKE